jgi:multiple sugar transport system substrate-binding protein
LEEETMALRSRHPILRSIALLFALALILTACAPAAEPTPTPAEATPDPAVTPDPAETPAETPEPATPEPVEGGEVIFLSTQLAPPAEAEAVRFQILADYTGGFPPDNFVPATAGEFADQVAAEAALGEGGGQVGVLGGLHGDFSPLVEQGQLMDLSDLAAELADRGFLEGYTELARYGTDQQYFIPWMQATYILAARQEAMEYLPEGADQNALTWEQVTEWGRNISEAGHGARLGFPAGEEGLWHRFFQGFGIPAYTGRVNTHFAGSRAEEMWQWLRDTWEYVNPQSTIYGFMQDPLQTAEVWVAWDHVARLRDAFVNDPDNFVAMPAPAGPEGRAFMPVVAGLAIPNSAPDVQAARDLIEYLTRPEIQAITLREVGFFPAIRADLPADLDPGMQDMANAVVNLTGAPDALPALLPVGLGEHGGAYNQVFRDTFEAIVIGGEDIRTVLNRERDNLQAVLDTAGADCWPPDPPTGNTCEVLEGPPGP